MITIVSDTHGTDGHRLEGRTLEAVREAELVLHAGDFTTEAVLDAFESEAGAEVDADTAGEFVAVYGNRDENGVRNRLDPVRVVERAGVRIAMVHGHEHDETTVGLLGRQEGADVVVVGHSHRPEAGRAGSIRVLNPGSHADPRQFRPAHVELEPAGEGLHGRHVRPNGVVIGEFDLVATGSE